MLNSNYLVSIIVPAYNVADYIESCLNSLKKQTYTNIEVIVINDGSIDNTEQKIDTTINGDLRFKKITQANQGLVSAINTGVNKARGDYVAFLDGDDFVGENFINNFIQNLEYPYDIVACGFYYYNPLKNEKTQFNLIDSTFNSESKRILINTLVFNNSFRLSNTFFVSRWNKLYKLSLIKQIIGIYKDYRCFYGEDTFFSLVALNYANSIKVLSKCNDYYYKLSTNPKKIDIDKELQTINYLNNLKTQFSSANLLFGNVIEALQISLIINDINTLLSSKQPKSAKKLLNSIDGKKIIKSLDFKKPNIKTIIFAILIKGSHIKLWDFLLKLKNL